MAFSALEGMLATERYRQRAATRRGGFSTPSLGYVAVEENALPLLVTNARGSFVPTHRNAEGFAPYGFTSCPVGEEGVLIRELHRALGEISTREGWPIRCRTVSEAIERLTSAGVKPSRLVVAEEDLWTILGEGHSSAAICRLMATQGFVAVVDGMQVAFSSLPSGSAFVAGPPSSVGIYTRVGEYLGVLLWRANRALMVVERDVA